MVSPVKGVGEMQSVRDGAKGSSSEGGGVMVVDSLVVEDGWLTHGTLMGSSSEVSPPTQ